MGFFANPTHVFMTPFPEEEVSMSASKKTMYGTLFTLIISSLLLTGCQNYKEGAGMFCNSLVLSGADKASEENRTSVLARWLNKYLQNDEVKQLYRSFHAMTPDYKVKALEKMAKRAGLAKCPLIKLFQPKKKPSKRRAAPVRRQ